MYLQRIPREVEEMYQEYHGPGRGQVGSVGEAYGGERTSASEKRSVCGGSIFGDRASSERFRSESPSAAALEYGEPSWRNLRGADQPSSSRGCGRPPGPSRGDRDQQRSPYDILGLRRHQDFRKPPLVRRVRSVSRFVSHPSQDCPNLGALAGIWDEQDTRGPGGVVILDLVSSGSVPTASQWARGGELIGQGRRQAKPGVARGARVWRARGELQGAELRTAEQAYHR
ncbi:hypothetical protein Q5P01_000846 [Channa striata]|uniref:Uncharacterized protein n=1 Tax=Channa striata TaxID=64152 RepID=A0AA88LMX4_CHASR|nr:hypothetical protein Q5P01_000846 [Channa striata]